MNELPAPRSVHDYRRFLQREVFYIHQHNEENLDFLLAFVDYHRLASPYFNAPLGVHSASNSPIKDLALGNAMEASKPVFSGLTEQEVVDITNKMKDSCKMMMETFVGHRASRELSITPRQRKLVVSELESLGS